MADQDFQCSECGFELYIPIVELGCSVLGLYDDARYPGRCLLAYNTHCEDFARLAPDELLAFTQDMQIAASAILAAAGADRMNYAILGNAMPHLHAHLVPRKRASDPVPDRSPWNHPEKASALPSTEIKLLIKKIRTEVLDRQRR